MTKTTQVSARLNPTLNDELTTLAIALDRPKSWVIEQAVREYVAVQSWQLHAIEEGLRAADAGQTVSHEDVAAWVRSWGKPDELPPPKCA